ncbi:MAG: hypothetical protein AB2A00_41345 [Myxococcota bacterium]
MNALVLSPFLHLLAAAEPVSVLVMPVANKEGVSKDLAEQVTAVITHVASSVAGFRVVAVAEIQGAMTQEQLKQMAGCDSVSCAAEIGGALNTEQVIIGSLGLVGDQYLLSLTRIRSRDATRLSSVVERVAAKPESKLFDRLDGVVPSLFEDRVAPVPERARPKAPPRKPAEADAPEEERSRSPLPWVIRGLGLGGFVLAVPPVVVAAALLAVVGILVVQDGGPTFPGTTRTHRITPLQAMLGDVSGLGAVLFGTLALLGVTLSLALVVLSVVAPS